MGAPAIPVVNRTLSNRAESSSDRIFGRHTEAVSGSVASRPCRWNRMPSRPILPELWPNRPQPWTGYSTGMTLTLDQIVTDFAAGMFEADRKRPVFITRAGRAYQSGIAVSSGLMGVQNQRDRMGLALRKESPGRRYKS